MAGQEILLKTGTNEMELLSVIVGEQPFGMNVAKVQSIQQADNASITPLPESGKGVVGMFLYRNKTIPMLDLAEILGIDIAGDGGRQIIVVTEFNNSVNCFKVQGVQRIHRLSWEEFVPINPLMEQGAFFSGSVNVDNTEILVLDLEHILAGIFPDLVLEDVSDDVINRKKELNRDQLPILFAEDSSTMRRGIMRVLGRAGFTSITDFVNGQLALDYIRTQHRQLMSGNRPVVLISDIEMPRMDGLTLCRLLKQDPELKEIYVIMFSSLINSQMIEKCRKVNADNYVTKPETTELVKILDKLCGLA